MAMNKSTSPSTAIYLNRRSLLTTLCGCLLFLTSWSQDLPKNRYVVFLADKDTITYSLDRPEEFLSPASLERRQQQNIALDASDLPVNPQYVAALAASGADIYYTSRWLNAVMIAGGSDSSAYRQLDFVTRVELIKPTRQGSRTKKGSSYDGEVTATSTAHREEQLLNMLQNEMLGIDEMHQAGYTGQGVSVAVFDGGFKGVDTVSFFQHLYENGQIIPGYDFVGNSPTYTATDNTAPKRCLVLPLTSPEYWKPGPTKRILCSA